MVPLALARWHKVLKSGCEVVANRTAERLERAVTVNAAWLLAAMTLLGRETPELPAEVMFSDIAVLRDFAADRKLPAPLDLGTDHGDARRLPQARRTARLQGGSAIRD